MLKERVPAPWHGARGQNFHAHLLNQPFNLVYAPRTALVGGLIPFHQRFRKQRKRVQVAFPQLPAEDLVVGHLRAPTRSDDQAGGQVAAVDGGDIARVERLQVKRVVPIQEVPAVALQVFKRFKGRRQPGGQAKLVDVAQIIGRQGGIEQQTDIGRRGAVGYNAQRVLLKMVGRQPVILRPNKAFEEGPRLAGYAAQVLRLILIQPGAVVDHRAADPQHNLWGKGPKQQHRRRPRQLAGIHHHHPDGQEQRQQQRQAHPPPGNMSRVALIEQARGVRGGSPLQEMAAAEQEPVKSGEDRVQRYVRLIRQEGHCQQPADNIPGCRTEHGARRLTAHQLHPGARKADQHWDSQAEQYQQGPEERPAGQVEQPENEQRHQGRGQQRAAQVINDLPAVDHLKFQFGWAFAKLPGRQQPGQKLPVTANPAVVAQGLFEVARRVIFHHRHIGHQPSPAH